MKPTDDQAQLRFTWGAESDPHGIQPRMVILARESRGMTQSELAGHLGVTQGEISKIEGGVRGISDPVLKRLTEVLHYPPSFFYQDERVYGVGIGELFHRRRRDIPVKVLAKIHAKVNIRRIHMTRLLRAADVPTCKIPHADFEHHARGVTDAAIADIARGVRAAWLLPRGPIENLCGAIEDAGGIIIPCDFETRQVDAISQWLPGLPPFLFINTGIPQDRVRYSLAHELGHLIMHQGSHSNLDATLNPDVEKQANTFASEFLMPERDIKVDLVELTLAKLAVLKPYWRVAMQALLMRARDLEQITARRFKTLWTEMSKAGYRTREPAELDITGESPTILRELLDYHRRGLGYSLEELGGLLDSFEDETEVTYFPKRQPRLRVVG